MPKIDPVTGCKVMTTGEFWASEAQKEGQGRTGGDLQGEFLDEMEADRNAEENRLRKPEVALEEMQRAVKDCNEADPEADQLPMPVAVLEVKEVVYSQRMRTGSTRLVLRCSVADGKIGTFTLEAWSSSGSMMEPPESEEIVTFEDG